MATFGEAITQIASEINRTDKDTLIGTAIQTALRKHQENKVAFNQDIDSSQTTSASSENLTLPADYFSISSVRIIYGTNDQAVLRSSSWTDMQAYDNTITGRPVVYCIFDGVIKLRPIPDAAYSVVISYYKKATIPLSSGDTHLWLTNAESLIKWEAKSFLYADVLEDEQRATWFAGMADNELRRILRVSTDQTQSKQLSYN
jgi:hypothetical protein